MRRRSLLTLAVAVACFAAAPAGPPTPADLSPADAPEPAEPAGALPTNEGFAALLRTDPVRAFEVVLKRCNEYHKYTCTMEKHERINGKLKPPEVVWVAFRDEPFSVFMKWEGVPEYRYPYCTLYARGDNGGTP